MRMGLPRVLTTDNGSEFKNKLNAEMMKLLGIRQCPITPYHPQLTAPSLHQESNLSAPPGSISPQQSTPPACPQQSTPPASPQQSTPPASPQQSTPLASPQQSTSPASPQQSTPPLHEQQSTSDQDDFYANSEDEVLFSRFKSEMDGLKPELIAIINGAITSQLHDVYWHGNKQEKSAIRHAIGCDYGPIKTLPDHLRQLGGYTSHTFPPTSTSGDINNLNPNGVYQFSVVAQVTITGQLYSGDIPPSRSTITPDIPNQRAKAMSECAAYEEVGVGGHESDDVKMVMQQCDAYGQVGQKGWEHTK
eukprot:Em0011g920a